MQSSIKSIFLKYSSIGLCICLPLNANANPQIAKSNPEKLIGAVDLGEDFSKLPKPLIAINGSPEQPNEQICAKPALLDDRIDCRYQTTDGLIYRIDDQGKIYEINMVTNNKGNFPKKLPLGIKPYQSQETLIKNFEKNGLVWERSTTHGRNFHVSACFYNDAQSKMTCFEYNKKMQIYKMAIFYKSPND